MQPSRDCCQPLEIDQTRLIFTHSSEDNAHKCRRPRHLSPQTKLPVTHTLMRSRLLLNVCKAAVVGETILLSCEACPPPEHGQSDSQQARGWRRMPPLHARRTPRRTWSSGCGQCSKSRRDDLRCTVHRRFSSRGADNVFRSKKHMMRRSLGHRGVARSTDLGDPAGWTC